MIVKSTFAMGLEGELPSSLPQGYPYFCTDSRNLFVGRGNSEAPTPLVSNEIEDILRRIVGLEDDVLGIHAQLDERLGQVGFKNVDEAEIGDGKILFFDEISNTFKYIDPLNIFIEGVEDGKKNQVTVLDVTASVADPYKIYVDIPYTLNFNRRPLEVLKFLPSQDNIVTIAATFNNREAADFFENPYVLFDGAMKLKTVYEEEMTEVDRQETGAIYKSILIDFSEFKFIEELQIKTPNVADKVYTLIRTENDKHYTFTDSEWVDVKTATPTQVDFTTKGMIDLRVTTNVTTNARFTLNKVRNEDTGFIHETMIDVNLFKKINKIKVRQ